MTKRVKGPDPADPISQVAAELRAGRITIDQAVDRLIDDAIARHVGAAASERPGLADKLREALHAFAGSDPFLAAKTRRITRGK